MVIDVGTLVPSAALRDLSVLTFCCFIGLVNECTTGDSADVDTLVELLAARNKLSVLIAFIAFEWCCCCLIVLLDECTIGVFEWCCCCLIDLLDECTIGV